MLQFFTSKPACIALVIATSLGLFSCSNVKSDAPFTVSLAKIHPYEIEVTGSLTKKVTIDVNSPADYAALSLYLDDTILINALAIPSAGKHQLTALVRFPNTGNTSVTLKAHNADIKILNISVSDVNDLNIPQYRDISEQAGLEKVSSIKYGGPSIADIDNDGDYDFTLNNHNAESSKLYWNNGDGTVTKHDTNLSRWFRHDLHGTAFGDYDNDGDLDMVLTQGGGNGTNPSRANFMLNQDNNFVRFTGDVGIEKGGRGRGARWSDMDLDGDLDLLLLNETSLAKEKPQQFFYENNGDGTLSFKTVDGIQDVEPSRALVTDLNNDNIDDIILYGPLSVWQGNGDFTFTDITGQLPVSVIGLTRVMAVTDIDIDNDGDLDLYLARGKEFEHGFGEAPSVDFDPITTEFSIKPRGYKGTNDVDFTAEGSIRFHSYNFMTQGVFRGTEYPIFLGSSKTAMVPNIGDEITIDPEQAKGWPNNRSESGIYLGFLGDGKWKASLHREGDMFWTFTFSLSGVNSITPSFTPDNRNHSDLLLRNDGGSFVDVTAQYNIPKGGNSLGVTTGDFNNDSFQDLLVYRWGNVAYRIADLMLLNTGNGHFETTTMHGASDIGGPGNGDMGQAFDFNLDGDIDLLSGSEDGEWYLYSNEDAGKGNFATVRVGYSAESNIDPIAAEVILTTPSKTYRKRVGSAGEIFSQSLLNMVHFGLGSEEKIQSITVRWRNGETAMFTNKVANALYDTNKLDPQTMSIQAPSSSIRKDSTMALALSLTPINASQSVIWRSSDESIMTVDQKGNVTAVGDTSTSAVITAASKENAMTSAVELTINEWFAIPADTLFINNKPLNVYEQTEQQLTYTVGPPLADNTDVVWTSSNSKVATVNSAGLVTTLTPGKSVISARITDTKVSDQFDLIVAPFIEPFINITNADQFDGASIKSGGNITVEVEYHAGSGNQVISSDEGGMRFWIRHFKSEWIPEKDVVLTDPDVLGTVSGSSSMRFSLDGYTPTAELPQGHFYMLRASFTNSQGKSVQQDIFPLNIVAEK